MSPKTKWILAALALGAVIACMKAGDGMGLDLAGRVCTDDSKDTICFPYINRCKNNPNLPQCRVDPCVATPTSKACSTSMCEKDMSHPWCQSIDCATTPTAQICVDSCKTHPDLAWCKATVDCNATPTLQVCADSCTNHPELNLAWCGPPKTRFSDVYAVITGSICLTACHIPGGAGVLQGKLNMATLDSAYANLVGANREGVLVADQTLAPGWVRVKPFFPDSSVFYLKLAGAAASLNLTLPDGKPYNATMPIGGAPLVKAKLDIIKKWILDGAVK